jgi:hypothetical protein
MGVKRPALDALVARRGLVWRLVTLGALILGVFLLGDLGVARAEGPG